MDNPPSRKKTWTMETQLSTNKVYLGGGLFCCHIFGERARLTSEISTGKKYSVTIDWEGKLYIGIALKWDYEKGTVQLSMTGSIRASLHAF